MIGAIIGIIGQIKAAYWITFCAIIGGMSLIEISVGTATYGLSYRTKSVRYELKKILETYPREEDERQRNVFHKGWDQIQVQKKVRDG